MRLSRRAWTLVAAALVLVLGAGGFATWRYTDLFVPDRLCDGAVATKDVRRILGDGRLEVVQSRLAKDRAEAGGDCVIEAANGADLTLRSHGVRPDDERSPVDPAMSQPDRGPIGAFGNDTGWLMLPAGCRKAAGGATDRFPDRDADVLSADVRHRGKHGLIWQDAPSKETPDQEARTALARLAGDFGAALARSSGCGSDTVPDMHLTAPGPPVAPATDGRLCGLPGVATGGNRQELAERVGDPAAPLQSCWVYVQTLSEPAFGFTATTDTRYPALVATRERLNAPLSAGWRGTGANTTIRVPCGKDDLLLHLTTGRPDLIEPTGATAYTSRLFSSWADAVAAQRGCEPVAPK
ncbi:hypothetical protein ACFVFS_30350 [Kitasatospora sp. NPDC057692]|uniref:hypothetical protein n=1 Tax=Kitasatospora sp. NPDC057692 TaxID=3346215 RepID=UPI0036BE724D